MWPVRFGDLDDFVRSAPTEVVKVHAVRPVRHADKARSYGGGGSRLGILVGVLMVGLTGGIGSGKSAVAHRLAELGALVIDFDALAREVVAPGTEGLAEVVAAF